jgi:hypothetical protein
VRKPGLPRLRLFPRGAARRCVKGGATGVEDVVGIGLRRIPESHDAVADELVDGAG